MKLFVFKLILILFLIDCLINLMVRNGALVWQNTVITLLLSYCLAQIDIFYYKLSLKVNIKVIYMLMLALPLFYSVIIKKIVRTRRSGILL